MSMKLTVEQRLHNFYNSLSAADRKLVRRIIKRVKAKQRK